MDMLPKYTYTRQVIDETLRLYPPLWLMTRKALNDDHLGDFFVPAGTEIYISPYLIQRSPDLWEAPDHFDPDRMSPNNGLDRHELALLPVWRRPTELHRRIIRSGRDSDPSDDVRQENCGYATTKRSRRKLPPA